MTHSFISILPILSIFLSCPSCDKNGNVIPDNSDMSRNRLLIKIGSNTFNATLQDNPTTVAFKSLLPLTVNMKELNGNEKYADLSRDLIINASNPGTIQSGDLMLYGSNTLVLFYKSFSTSYSYTRLGRVDDVTGLAAAVGTGNVPVTFELEK